MGRREKLTKYFGCKTSDSALLLCNHWTLVECAFVNNGFESLSFLTDQIGMDDIKLDLH